MLGTIRSKNNINISQIFYVQSLEYHEILVSNNYKRIFKPKKLAKEAWAGGALETHHLQKCSERCSSGPPLWFIIKVCNKTSIVGALTFDLSSAYNLMLCGGDSWRCWLLASKRCKTGYELPMIAEKRNGEQNLTLSEFFLFKQRII